jgi:hypothetical protein
MYSNIVTKQTSRGIGPSLQRKNFNSQFKHFVMNENIGGSMNKVKKSVDIAPRKSLIGKQLLIVHLSSIKHRVFRLEMLFTAS